MVPKNGNSDQTLMTTMTPRMMSSSSKFSLFHYCLFMLTKLWWQWWHWEWWACLVNFLCFTIVYLLGYPCLWGPMMTKPTTCWGTGSTARKSLSVNGSPYVCFLFFYSPFYQFNKSEGQTTTGWTQAKTVETPVHVRQPLGNAGNQWHQQGEYHAQP